MMRPIRPRCFPPAVVFQSRLAVTERPSLRRTAPVATWNSLRFLSIPKAYIHPKVGRLDFFDFPDFDDLVAMNFFSL